MTKPHFLEMIVRHANRHAFSSSCLKALLLAAVLFGSSGPGAAYADSPKTVLVLVDLSSSTRPYRADYVKYFRIVLDSLGSGDTLLVGKIIKHPSAAESLAMPAIRYEAESFLKNRRRVQEMNIKRSLNALSAFQDMILINEDETPILEVLSSAPTLLANFPADRKIVVLLSDMMESSKATIDFDSERMPLTAKKAESTLKKLAAENSISNLKGVKIYIAGARDKDPKRFGIVKKFWGGYFSLSKASFDYDRYAQELLSFDECNQSHECLSFFRDGRDARIKKPEVRN